MDYEFPKNCFLMLANVHIKNLMYETIYLEMFLKIINKTEFLNIFENFKDFENSPIRI